jgi:hypothetical protein
VLWGFGGLRLGDDGELIIPRLPAEDVSAEAEALRDELAALLPHVLVASVLVEVDTRTGFTSWRPRLSHGRSSSSPGPAG